MDGGFSTVNLRRIWDLETRKGRELVHLFPDVRSTTLDARDKKRSLKSARRRSAADDVIAQEENAVDSAKAAVETQLLQALHRTGREIDEDILDRNFQWNLDLGPVRRTKLTYKLKPRAKDYFAGKELELNLSQLRTTVSWSRDVIVQQLARVLVDDIPKSLVRVDVAQFFESVPHDRLLSVLKDLGLSNQDLYLVEEFLSTFATLAGTAVGLPRGIGISSKLAEVYLSSVDSELGRQPGVIYYARYVDDIVMVVGRPNSPASSLSDHERSAVTVLNGLGLTVNTGKTWTKEVGRGTHPFDFDFLGYSFRIAGGVQIHLTSSRRQELRRRLDLTVSAWQRSDQANTGRQGLFLNRLRFLTGNARLSNNKRNALVGVHFSNRHLTKLDALTGLDTYLNHHISQLTLPASLEHKVADLSFVRGFEDRTVHRFTPSQLRDITRLWRDA